MEIAETRESLCEKTFCAVTHSDGEVQKYLAFPMRCKSWDCPKCRRLKSQEYRDRMKSLAELPDLYFYTFTYEREKTLQEAWASYNKSWNILRTRMVQLYGKFNYVRVLEAHKKIPYPHIHVISDRWFPPTVLGPAAVSAGFGYQIDSQRIDGVGALDYISKYLSKRWPSDEAIALRKENRCRIISFSRGLLSPKTRGSAWQMLIYGSDFGSCCDHILTDYTWRTEEEAKVIYEHETESQYEVHVIFERIVPPGAFTRQESIEDLRGVT